VPLSCFENSRLEPLTRLSRDCGIATLSPRERPINPETSAPFPKGEGGPSADGPGEGLLLATLPKNLTQEVNFRTSTLPINPKIH
jgi:hypothetical protein